MSAGCGPDAGRNTRPTPQGAAMRFEVPAGNTLVFSGPDGAVLAVPQMQSSSRTIEVDPED